MLAARHRKMARSLLEIPRSVTRSRVPRVTNRSDGVAVVIVCSCNVLSDHQVRSVTVEHCVRATSEVYRCLGCSAACGRCVRTIRDIMDEVHAERTIALPASPSICAASGPASSFEPAPLAPLPLAAEGQEVEECSAA